MDINIVPLSIRKIKHNNVGDYRAYLDELIGRKLDEMRRRDLLAKRYNKRLALAR